MVQKQHLRRPPGIRFDDSYTISTINLPPQSNGLGAMSKNRVVALFLLSPEVTMDRPNFVKIISEKLKL